MAKMEIWPITSLCDQIAGYFVDRCKTDSDRNLKEIESRKSENEETGNEKFVGNKNENGRADGDAFVGAAKASRRTSSERSNVNPVQR